MKFSPVPFLSINPVVAVAFAFLAALATPPAVRAETRHADEARTPDNGGHAAESGHEDEKEAGFIRLSPEQLIDFGIETEVAGPAKFEAQVTLPGEIKLNENLAAHVSPQYASMVREVHARLGDRVRRGQVLATMENTDTLVQFDVVAPIDGSIIERHITLGETFDAGEYLYIVADLSIVWVDLDLYRKDLFAVKRGQQVTVEAGHGLLPAQGVITYLGPVVNHETRTALARIELSNEDGRWKPGMFVTGHVKINEITVPVAIRKSAVQQVEGEPIVFVQTNDGLEPRDIQIGIRNSSAVEILAGVKEGEKVVTAGSFLLKSELEKEGFEAGHGH